MRTILAPQPVRCEPSWARTPAARRGAAGERLVRATLAATLDDTYVLMHNLWLPGGEGDVDAVVVGPRLVVVEVKTYAEGSQLRVRGMRWEYEAGHGRWRGLDWQPSAQAEANARRVAYALRSAGLPAYRIVPVVVLVGSTCTLERARIPVIRPAELPRFVREEEATPLPAGWRELAMRALQVAASAGADG